MFRGFIVPGGGRVFGRWSRGKCLLLGDFGCGGFRHRDIARLVDVFRPRLATREGCSKIVAKQSAPNNQ